MLKEESGLLSSVYSSTQSLGRNGDILEGIISDLKNVTVCNSPNEVFFNMRTSIFICRETAGY